MKLKVNYTFFIILPLLISLFVYLFLRSTNIMVNQILYQLFQIRLFHISSSAIPDFFIYNFPEGLWVFSATLISKNLYVKRFNLAFLPLIFSFYIEIIQYFHLTNGTFDFLDLVAAIGGCFLAYFIIPCPYQSEQLLEKITYRTFSFSFSYLIVFLSVYNIHHHFFGF